MPVPAEAIPCPLPPDMHWAKLADVLQSRNPAAMAKTFKLRALTCCMESFSLLSEWLDKSKQNAVAPAGKVDVSKCPQRQTMETSPDRKIQQPFGKKSVDVQNARHKSS